MSGKWGEGRWPGVGVSICFDTARRIYFCSRFCFCFFGKTRVYAVGVVWFWVDDLEVIPAVESLLC